MVTLRDVGCGRVTLNRPHSGCLPGGFIPLSRHSRRRVLANLSASVENIILTRSALHVLMASAEPLSARGVSSPSEQCLSSVRRKAVRRACLTGNRSNRACAYQKGLIRPVYKSRWPFQREQLHRLWPTQRNWPTPVVAYSSSSRVTLSVNNFDRCGLFIVDDFLSLWIFSARKVANSARPIQRYTLRRHWKTVQ